MNKDDPLYNLEVWKQRNNYIFRLTFAIMPFGLILCGINLFSILNLSIELMSTTEIWIYKITGVYLILQSIWLLLSKEYLEIIKGKQKTEVVWLEKPERQGDK